MPAIPERELVRARHLAARAGALCRAAARADAGAVTAAAAPIAAWLTAAADLADLRVRYMAAELHYENTAAAAYAPSRNVLRFLDGARLYYAALRGENPPEVREVGEPSGRVLLTLRALLSAAGAGDLIEWSELVRGAARYAGVADPPLGGPDYAAAWLLLFSGRPGEVRPGVCPSCGHPTAAGAGRLLAGQSWPCADSWHDAPADGAGEGGGDMRESLGRAAGLLAAAITEPGQPGAELFGPDGSPVAAGPER